jgi:hypothetical protein
MAAVGLAVVLAAGAAVALALHPWGKPDGPERVQPGPAAKAPPRLRLLVPAYFYPAGAGSEEWRRLLKAPDVAAVVIIVNPDSGPGKAADPNYTRVIDQARDKGFTLIGYVSTKYAKRPLAEVKADVDRWVNLYPGVQGIFFDEQASEADKVDYYAVLYEHARKERGLALVVNNPGTSCAEEYLARPAADVVCLAESTKEFGLFRPPGWAADYPASRFAAMLYKVADAGRMRRYVRAMAEKRVGHCYLTDNGKSNPWDRLPGYWEEELAAVREANGRKAP